MKWLTPARRKWIYNVILAATPILVAYGIVNKDEVALWLNLAANILGLSLARINVPQEDEEQ